MKESTRYLIALLLVVISLVVLVGYDYNKVNEFTLNDNQTEVHYMYSNDDGTYLLDSKADVENVIYVSHKDMINWIGVNYLDELEHGNKLIGTFRDDALWELVGLDKR